VLERNYDPGTFRLLEGCGVMPGWRCAEVGAGRGSVAAWLADAAGPRGSVVALDIDTSHLDHLAGRSNVVVRQHDIVADPIREASFDLVHTRLVIEHLPAPERLLEMLAKATRPGGVLVVECTDMITTGATDHSHHRGRAFDDFMAMSFTAVKSMSTFDLTFARRLPKLFHALGLDPGGIQVLGGIARGGDPKAVEFALPVVAMRSALIEGGHATADAIDEYLASLADPDFWFVANNLVAVWGRRPM
jgi:SAM-dependent methyltransferase